MLIRRDIEVLFSLPVTVNFGGNNRDYNHFLKNYFYDFTAEANLHYLCRMKRQIISLLLIITAFVVSTSQTLLPVSSNLLSGTNKPAGTTVKIDSQTESTYYFTATDLFSLLKQNSENIKTINSGGQTSIKTVYGFDKLFQLLCYARSNFRKFIINNKLFSHIFSHRQMDGYYIYYLCKMLN